MGCLLAQEYGLGAFSLLGNLLPPRPLPRPLVPLKLIRLKIFQDAKGSFGMQLGNFHFAGVACKAGSRAKSQGGAKF